MISRPNEIPKITILIFKLRAWFLNGPSYFCEPYIKFRNRTLGRSFQMAVNLHSSVIKPFENLTCLLSLRLINCTISIISNSITLILSKFREIWHADTSVKRNNEVPGVINTPGWGNTFPLHEHCFFFLHIWVCFIKYHEHSSTYHCPLWNEQPNLF